MGVIHFNKFLLLVAMASVSVLASDEEVKTLAEPVNAGFGFELVQKGLENLQYSFAELFVQVKELGEMVQNNQRSIEQSQVQINQSIKRNQKQITDRVEDLESGVAANVSLMIGYSKEILNLQTICANHELIKRELLKIKPIFAEQSHHHNSITSETNVIKSCDQTGAAESGLFNMSFAIKNEPVTVFCELKDFDGGWLVIQQRTNGAINFKRNWTEYKDGFGAVGEEFWFGLDLMHELTNSGTYELVIELRDFGGQYSYARYSHFVVGGEDKKYALENLGEFSGTADDSLTSNVGRMFSTFDEDNDDNPEINCAVVFEGAWWHGGPIQCFDSNLNGNYRNSSDWMAITWKSSTPMKYTRMMIRKIIA